MVEKQLYCTLGLKTKCKLLLEYDKIRVIKNKVPRAVLKLARAGFGRLLPGQ